jgi:hypothetical protein
VDHNIYVLLFDANPFTSSSLIERDFAADPSCAAPAVSHILVRQGVAAKDVTLTFEKLSAPSVYVIVFFDKNGTYNGQPDTMWGGRWAGTESCRTNSMRSRSSTAWPHSAS